MQKGRVISFCGSEKLVGSLQGALLFRPYTTNFPVFSRENDGIIVRVLCFLGCLRDVFFPPLAPHFTYPRTRLQTPLHLFSPPWSGLFLHDLFGVLRKRLVKMKLEFPRVFVFDEEFTYERFFREVPVINGIVSQMV